MPAPTAVATSGTCTTCTRSRSSATSRPHSRSTASTSGTASGSSSPTGRTRSGFWCRRRSVVAARLSFAGHGPCDRHQPGPRAGGSGRPALRRAARARGQRRHPGVAPVADRHRRRPGHRRRVLGARGDRAPRRCGLARRAGRGAAGPADRRRWACVRAGGGRGHPLRRARARRARGRRGRAGHAAAARGRGQGRRRRPRDGARRGRRRPRSGARGADPFRRLPDDRRRRLAPPAPAPPRRSEVPRAARVAMTAAGGPVNRKKLILAVVDGLGPELLDRAIVAGRASTMARLAAAGERRDDCVSTFPSLTPVCLAALLTGEHPAGSHIPGMTWYHRGERRLVEYGSSFAATLAEGTRQMVDDILVNMNLVHLSPSTTTIFEFLEDAGYVTAGVNTYVCRGRVRHPITRPVARSLARRIGIVDAVYGPRR